MTTGELITLALAIWGALLSTILAVRTVVRDRREDGRLRVRAWAGRETSYDSIKPFCVFEVVNVGRRTAYFGGLWLLDGKGKQVDAVMVSLVDGTYEKLEPGAAREPISEDDRYDNVENLLRTRRVYAVDPVRGRTYISRWRLWRMRREILKIQAAHRALIRKRDARAKRSATSA